MGEYGVLLESALTMVFLQLAVYYPRALTASMLNGLMVMFASLSMFHVLVRGSSFSKRMEPLPVSVAFRMWSSISFGNFRLSFFLQTAITALDFMFLDRNQNETLDIVAVDEPAAMPLFVLSMILVVSWWADD